MSIQLNHNDQDLEETIGHFHRQLPDEQRRKFEGYAAELFAALGMDLNTPATQETPKRFIQALFDATDGYDGDPKLIKVFDTECRGEPDCRLSQVIEGPINFFSLCEHHAFPFFGQAYVGYIAHENILGISEADPAVRACFRALRGAGKDRSADCRCSRKHVTTTRRSGLFGSESLMCRMRVREVALKTRTTVWRGHYANDPSLRAEFFNACRLQR
jgi:GTP cyclohydrolase I